MSGRRFSTRVQLYWHSARAYSLIILVLFFMAGGAVAGGAVFAAGPMPYWLLPAAVFVIGWGGTILSDIEHRDTDQLGCPGRPICNGDLNVREATIISSLAIATGVIILACFSLAAIVVLAAGFFVSAFYTYFKRNWLGGLLNNFLYFSATPLAGFFAYGGSAGALDHKILYLSLCCGAWVTAYVVLGYMKDVSSDKTTGFNTLPVLFGFRMAVWAGAILTVVALLLTLVLQSALESPGTLPQLIAFGMALTTVALLYRVRDERQVSRYLEWFLRGMILSVFFLLSDMAGPGAIYTIFLLVLFEVSVQKRLDFAQI